jgi:hypothetical protein
MTEALRLLRAMKGGETAFTPDTRHLAAPVERAADAAIPALLLVAELRYRRARTRVTTDAEGVRWLHLDGGDLDVEFLGRLQGHVTEVLAALDAEAKRPCAAGDVR